MSNEIKGYYCKKKNALLKDFSQTIEGVLKDQKYNALLTGSVQNELVLEYEKIIPDIPYFEGSRQKMFNNMLIISSQVLAAYRVLTKRGKSPEEIWEICHYASFYG